MKNNKINRRDFMKLLLSSSVVGSTAQLALMQKALANNPNSGDYKALVCVFLEGGNDSFNMLIPSGGAANTGYDDYAAIRGNLAVADNYFDLSTITNTDTDLNSGILGKGENNPYNIDRKVETAYTSGMYNLADKGIDLGVNGVMPELAQLITDNKASVISNIGTSVRPVNRDQILAGNAELPSFLFAHDQQQRVLQTGRADDLNGIGWAGKIADLWLGNNNSPLGLNVTFSGSNRLQIGRQSSASIIRPDSRLTDMLPGKNSYNDDRRSLFKSLMGIENTSPSGNITFDATNTHVPNDDFKRVYASSLNKALNTSDFLYDTYNTSQLNYQATGSYGEPLFDKVSKADLGFNADIKGSFISQLENVAKMINLGANGELGGSNRQIFYVRLSGFDTHSGQATKHPLLLRELSLGLWKFQKAMEELGHTNKVTTFTMSDFGRSMTNNGDGTDHAWGAHHIVMGSDGQNTAGNLRGGQILGDLPDITLQGADDHDKRGRIIPTTAQEQLNATLCSWFGVNQNDISTIFGNLSNFEAQEGVASSAYLDSLFVA